MEPIWRDQITESVFVIGNGESRLGIDLDSLQDFNTVGCNAIHRDFIPDHLVCCDKRMVDESLKNPLTYNTKIYTRKDWAKYYRKIQKKKNVFEVPALPYKGSNRQDQPIHWGSGNYAVLLAAMHYQNIIMIGFDLYDTNNQVNNVYKDTSNYSPKNSKPVDPSYWIYQISKVMEIYYHKNFFIINSATWKPPKEWGKSNVTFENISDFSLTNK